MAVVPTALSRMFGELKRRSLRFRPGPHPDIAVFGQRRGGSTLLADGIALERGVFIVNEPFATWASHGRFAEEKRRLLPARPHGQLFDLSEEEWERVAAYVRGIRAGRHRLGRARTTRVGGVVDRTLLKILNAPTLIAWFAEELGMEVLLLCRHPAPQALSVLRQGWGFSAEAYLANETWCEDHFTPTQIDLARRILAGDDRWRKAILNWVLEAQLPLRLAPPGVSILTYEDLVLYPRETFGQVAARLGLGVTEAFVLLASRPSGSSRLSTSQTRRRIEAGDRRYLLDRWQEEVDAEARDAAQAILDAFEVELYRMDDPLPRVSRSR